MGQTRTGKNSGARNGRVIMHLDMDAFFVNVELLENPALRGEPIIVAPLGPRSVVCSASYEARAHGVRSGMPLSRARNLSPNATVLPLRGDYRHYSRAVMAILNDLSPYVEQVSVDEAFVDLTGAYLHGQDPVALAQHARDRIAQELSLPSSSPKWRPPVASRTGCGLFRPSAFKNFLTREKSPTCGEWVRKVPSSSPDTVFTPSPR